MDKITVRAKFFFEGEKKFFVKGVTYGPFAPDAEGEFFGSAERAAQDFALMREAGINVLRVYYVPPKWFMDMCAAHGLRVLITLPWAEHVEFLRDRKVRREIERSVAEGVARHAGHPAVFGYLVGNEIPSTMVRWLGVREVTEFVEHLINIGRKADPSVLFSFASYPPTEYLLPQNADFTSFNVYLHAQKDFENYLARLQNLADDKPLLLSECGMDTIRHTEDEQADMMRWHVESVVRGGLAGTVVFSWTDEWYRGGQEITDWAFGLVTRERKPKKAFYAVKEFFHGEQPMIERVRLPRYPKVSVIVCSYNGGKTLGRCLESLKYINYPDYEVVLVDDGSKDNTPEIVAQHPWVVAVQQENKGLSVARNVGARTATGEVIVYTDSDCMADPDWLYFLIGTLLSGDYAGVGGPNISPPAEDWIQACVSAAPGGPNHVLLTDVVAEHVPGCNMGYYKWAFEQIGGFDPEYRKAGDDVDFCWRLQQSGGVIAFSPAAIVWHYRRFTLDAFRKQQEGYGEAESMLRFKHLVFFGPTGTAKWKGQIYGAPRFTWLINRPVVYHGVFGEGLFQSIYPTPQSEIAAYVSSIEWVALATLAFAFSIPLPALRIVPLVMFGATFLVALSYMIHARIEPRYDTWYARLLVTALALVQPLARGWARYFTWLKFKRTPERVIAAPERDAIVVRGSKSRLALWNEEGRGRETLISEVLRSLDEEGWSYSTDTGWKGWDIQVYGSFWWGICVKTVTEYHGGPKCLTRVSLRAKMVATTFLLHALLLIILGWRQVVNPGGDIVLWILYAIVAFVFLVKAHKLKARIATLVATAAARCGLKQV